jgi:hypothetical protein
LEEVAGIPFSNHMEGQQALQTEPIPQLQTILDFRVAGVECRSIFSDRDLTRDTGWVSITFDSTELK